MFVFSFQIILASRQNALARSKGSMGFSRKHIISRPLECLSTSSVNPPFSHACMMVAHGQNVLGTLIFESVRSCPVIYFIIAKNDRMGALDSR